MRLERHGTDQNLCLRFWCDAGADSKKRTEKTHYDHQFFDFSGDSMLDSSAVCIGTVEDDFEEDFEDEHKDDEEGFVMRIVAEDE